LQIDGYNLQRYPFRLIKKAEWKNFLKQTTIDESKRFYRKVLKIKKQILSLTRSITAAAYDSNPKNRGSFFFKIKLDNC